MFYESIVGILPSIYAIFSVFPQLRRGILHLIIKLALESNELVQLPGDFVKKNDSEILYL